MVKVLEQYTTKLDPSEHLKMQEAAKWLHENGFLTKTNKYEVTRYALQTLIGIVDNKKKRAEEDDAKQDAKRDAKNDSKGDAKNDKESKVVP